MKKHTPPKIRLHKETVRALHDPKALADVAAGYKYGAAISYPDPICMSVSIGSR